MPSYADEVLDQLISSKLSKTGDLFPAGSDGWIFLPHGTVEQRGLQNSQAPADGLRPSQQLPV